MNRHLFAFTLSSRRVTLLAVCVAAVGWGTLVPVFYVSFSDLFKNLIAQGVPPIVENLFNFGSGSFFTLPGALTIGLQHPLAIAFVAIFAVGGAARVIAGEREDGTLEVLLSRPLSRRGLYASVGLALLAASGLVLALLLGGQLLGSALLDVLDQIDPQQMVVVWAVGLMLWTAFLAFSLAASVSFDRYGPAIGLSLVYLLVNYFLEIVGSLWTDVAWSQEYSLFHHFQPGEILQGNLDPVDLLILGAAILVPVAYALLRFPRRDLAAPA